MFEGLFHALRRNGVPVALDEWLTLQTALSRNLAGSSLAGFYLMARSLVTKSEQHYDAYDVAFAEYFSGLIATPEEVGDHVMEWLKDTPEALKLSPEDRARIDAMLENLDIDELRRRFEERLRNQTEAHQGGSKHIGTGGTSGMGHSGSAPGGIRIGGESMWRSAVQVAGDRRFREYRADRQLGVREFGSALRRLRRLSDRVDGPATELDLDASIDATADAGGQLNLVFRRPRHNTVRLVLLLDVGGSMDDHIHLVDRLFSAVNQASRFRELTVRYFHNCVYDRIYEDADMSLLRSEPTMALLNRMTPDHMCVVVGDGCMAPSELALPGGCIDWSIHNEEPGWIWLERVRQRFAHCAWLNPVPEHWWTSVHGARTLNAIRELFPMCELSLQGLDEAIDHLLARPA
ncbi:MAG: VWA domain-containing protein [Thermoleophilia bacterium]